MIHSRRDGQEIGWLFFAKLYLWYINRFLFPAIRTTFYPKIWFSNWWNWSIKDTCSLLALQSNEKKISCCSLDVAFRTRVSRFHAHFIPVSILADRVLVYVVCNVPLWSPHDGCESRESVRFSFIIHIQCSHTQNTDKTQYTHTETHARITERWKFHD